MKQSVLFVCVHNSARSQMAEAILNELCPDDFSAESAGLEPGELSPLAVAVMGEAGIDISGKSTKSVFDLFKAGRLYSYVITVCDDASADKCPVFPGHAKRLHWSIPDPAALEGSWEERIEKARLIRQQIRDRIEAWCAESCANWRQVRPSKTKAELPTACK